MKKILAFALGAIFLAACQSSDCSNGQQDGNETGVDCGSDCAPCNTSNLNNTEILLQGLWKESMNGTLSQNDTVWTQYSGYVNPGFVMEFTATPYTLANAPAQAKTIHRGTYQSPQLETVYYYVDESTMNLHYAGGILGEIISIDANQFTVYVASLGRFTQFEKM